MDVTLPGRRPRPGSLHPLTIVEYEIVDIFTRMGYRVVEGPEVETEYYNFDALNIPPEHPARRVSDSIYVDVPGHPNLLLRTETSAMQIRTMEKQPPPVYVIAPGRVFRRDEIDATHMPVFHQVEGLAVDEGITLADLKGTLETFYRALLGDDVRLRFTPSFFPFVEPGAQVEVSCFVCGGVGCRVCGNGWIEVMGAGMVHPNVLRGVGYDPERYTGFAFGGGLRPADHGPVLHPRHPHAVRRRRPVPGALRGGGMRVPLHWLREHCPTDMEVGELADRLSQQGVHVEGVLRPWEGLSGVIVAEVLEKRPHPNSDHLTLAPARHRHRRGARRRGGRELGGGRPRAVRAAGLARSGAPRAPVGSAHGRRGVAGHDLLSARARRSPRTTAAS